MPSHSWHLLYASLDAGLPCLFLPSSTSAEGTNQTILELQAVSPPNERSWFIGQDVVADGKLLLLTPIDPAFLLIPILRAVYPPTAKGDKGLFRPMDEIFDDAADNLAETTQVSADKDTHISKDDVQALTSLPCCHSAMKRVCDFQDATEDLAVYRFSTEKLVSYLRCKVDRLATAEMTEVSRTIIRSLAKDGLMETGREELLRVGRIKAACDLISQYTPPDILELLKASYDFAALDSYFKTMEDENIALLANDKPVKAKKTAAAPTDKKRKTGASTGVEKLKKAKTTGMPKLSNFFTKKAAS
ncbi:unnamed protein product [Mycena citricolor]|uniref:Ribonuclease H2 subunit B n=1 Tax=Mycena citricolor TaxID=2018698 RepID=A0AAD2HVC7_9AGAR|nr:unnamed protein product [Mycena citricolor]